jgi:cytochrome c553
MKEMLFIALAACFSASAVAAGDADRGAQKSQMCAGCHGPDGNAPQQADYPRLAGQHPDYLYKALRDYKSGARKNAIMSGMAGGLNAQDMQDLAAFFSRQTGTLHVKR